MPEPTILYSNIEERDIAVHLSRRAMRTLENRKAPLYVNMELYFSCLVKKIVHFFDSPTIAGAKVSNKLFVSFRPVQSKSCNMQDLGTNSEPTLIDLPVAKKKAIVPRHLFIDYKRGKWKGDFTWNLK